MNWIRRRMEPSTGNAMTASAATSAVIAKDVKLRGTASWLLETLQAGYGMRRGLWCHLSLLTMTSLSTSPLPRSPFRT